MFRWYSMSTFSSKAPGPPDASAITEWSMTSSTGTSGLTLLGSPPSVLSASRMAARSTTQGTPVKSCMRTRSGVRAISAASSAPSPWRSGRLPQPATASMSAGRTARPSSWRRRFSSTTFIEYGSLAMSKRSASALIR